MPFETDAMLLNLKKVLASTKSNYVATDRDFWTFSFASRVRDVAFDEDWYVDKYQDVAKAIERGELASGLDHYAHSGYYEHRLPYKINVDEAWYLTEYPDVRIAIARSVYRSAQEHFEEVGYREGRHPYPHFALRKRDEVEVEKHYAADVKQTVG